MGSIIWGPEVAEVYDKTYLFGQVDSAFIGRGGQTWMICAQASSC